MEDCEETYIKPSVYNTGEIPALASLRLFWGLTVQAVTPMFDTTRVHYSRAVVFNLCQPTPFTYALVCFYSDEHEKCQTHIMTYLHFMSVLHIRLACSLEMMMHITLMKMRKFTWRNGRRIYITINKYMCISTEKGLFVYACVGLCVSCYAAAAEFTTELCSLLGNCGLNVNAQATLENRVTSLHKARDPTYSVGSETQ